jgi:hypothetical protein
MCKSGYTCQLVGNDKTECLPGGEEGGSCNFSKNSPLFPLSFISFFLLFLIIRRKIII